MYQEQSIHLQSLASLPLSRLTLQSLIAGSQLLIWTDDFLKVGASYSP